MPKVRFNVFTRFPRFLGYHHVLMILIAIAIILASLLLAGCSSSSPAIPNIFLITLYYKEYPPSFDPSQVDPGVIQAVANVVNGACLEVRVGYFGICINPGGSFLCSNNATVLAQQIARDQDPWNLLWVAETFKDLVVFPYLLIIALIFSFICFLLLATFPGWHDEPDPRTGSDVEVKPFPSRPVSQAALALIFISSVFVLVSVLWQHTASVSAAQITRDFGNGSINSGVGVTAMILGWFTFGIMVVVTIGLLIMILSITLVRRLAAGGGD